VSSQLHAQGIYSFQEIVYAQIEPNGQITAVCEGSEMPSVIIMKSGKAREYALNEIEKDTRWLEDEMKKASVIYEDVFIAEFWSGRLTFILKDGEVKKSYP
jgi:uncharacterized membrane protein YcaP (DUF421 family)